MSNQIFEFPCPHCHGTGHATQYDYPGHNTSANCPHCLGTGFATYDATKTVEESAADDNVVARTELTLALRSLVATVNH
jgi:DnaJ-class molecular chaperone